MYSRVQSSRLYQQIVDQIEALILEGKLHPGDQLPSERELAEQFSVSRTAVHEAVKALSEKVLVAIEGGRGTFITQGVSKALRRSLGWIVQSGEGNPLANLVQVRTILEPEIAAIAAEVASEQDLESLERAVNVMDFALTNADVYVEADLEFHLALARATQNRLIPTLIDPIVDLLGNSGKVFSWCKVALSADSFTTNQFWTRSRSAIPQQRSKPCKHIWRRCATIPMRRKPCPATAILIRQVEEANSHRRTWSLAVKK